MPWLMLAKMPLLISSRITSAGLTPNRSARSLTVTLDGSSMAARVRGSAVAVAPCINPSRRIGLRGPRRPRVPLLLLATTISSHDPARLPCPFGSAFSGDRHSQRSLERSFVQCRTSALIAVTYIGPAAVHLAGRINHNPAVRSPHDTQELALLPRRPADDARSRRIAPWKRGPAYEDTSASSTASLDLTALRRLGLAGASTISATAGAATTTVLRRLGLGRSSWSLPAPGGGTGAP